MNLAQTIDQLFATASREEIDELLRKANFDHYNKVGVDFLSPEQAVREATASAETFSSTVAPAAEGEGDRAWSPPVAPQPVIAAGNYEEMPLAA